MALPAVSSKAVILLLFIHYLLLLLSHGLIHVYNTLLLPCGRSWVLQLCGRVLACRLSDPGSIPGLDRLIYFCSRTMAPNEDIPPYDDSVQN